MGTFRPKKEGGRGGKEEMYCKGKRDPSCLRRRNWKFLFFGWVVALLSSLSLSDLEGVVYGAVDPVVRRHHHHPVPPKVLQHGNHRFGDLKQLSFKKIEFKICENPNLGTRRLRP